MFYETLRKEGAATIFTRLKSLSVVLIKSLSVVSIDTSIATASRSSNSLIELNRSRRFLRYRLTFFDWFK
jgi:hypothetical protein